MSCRVLAAVYQSKPKPFSFSCLNESSNWKTCPSPFI
uniref:Uncharacterized protein n=1 Tax=Anguilla anguilla TaxID=7936 RepID=A0A0E9QNC7_ANGAN